MSLRDRLLRAISMLLVALCSLCDLFHVTGATFDFFRLDHLGEYPMEREEFESHRH